MTLSPLQLAAIVSAGVPGIYPVGAEPVREDSDDFDSAIIADSTGRRWRVCAPRRPDASMRLEAEHLILQSFSPGLRARLPFAVPTVAGTVPYAGGNVFVYTHIPGTIYDVDQLAELSRREVAANRPSLASIIAKDIATLHVMPEDIIYEADLPSYSSEQIRLRKNAELERAAATGKVPADLLAHWRAVLSPGPMWQFRPRVVHGDMGAENLVLHVTPAEARIVEVTGWSEVHVGDPAQDFAWLYSCQDIDFTDEAIEVYRQQMPQLPDAYLAQRANFYAEFAIAQWLTHTVEVGDRDGATHAVSMLLDIQDDLRASGELLGQEEVGPLVGSAE